MDFDHGIELYVSFPEEGRVELPVGETVINWRKGVALLANGKEHPTSAYLPETRIFRSLLVMAEHRLKLKLDYGEKTLFNSGIFAGNTPIRNIPFEMATIKANQPNKVYLLASTDITGASIDEARIPVPVVFGYQSEVDHLWVSDAIPPKRIIAHTAFTVPKGSRLLLKGGMVSASKGGMHRVFFSKSPGMLGDWRFQYWEPLTFDPSNEVLGGRSLKIFYENNSTERMRGTVSFIGVLEELI